MLTRGVHRTHRLLAAVAIVARHILGYLFGLLRLDRLVHFGHGRSRAGRPTRFTGPEHVRLAVEELGVASIKIGQILSTRTDLLTPAYQVELAKLQDSAPPEPTAIIRECSRHRTGFAHRDRLRGVRSAADGRCVDRAGARRDAP